MSQVRFSERILLLSAWGYSGAASASRRLRNRRKAVIRARCGTPAQDERDGVRAVPQRCAPMELGG